MKFLIASEGGGLGDSVSLHFTRAPFFILFDPEKGSCEDITNNGESRPEIVIHESAKHGVKGLICGHVEPDVFLTAQDNSLTIFLSPPITVRKAVEMASKNQLRIAQAPTIFPGRSRQGGS